MRFILAAAAITAMAGPAAALTSYDSSVTPPGDLLFGNGNTNEAFKVETVGDIEIGLRGKLRFDLSGNPAAVYNSDGAGGYAFETTDGVPDAGRSIFNFDWSVNVDRTGAAGGTLNQFTYEMTIDYDPGPGVGATAGVDVQVFDPINLASADHGLGDFDTPGPGATGKPYVVTGEGGDLAMSYPDAIDTFSVAQNSWNLGFFEPGGFDPQTLGIYTISLAVFDLALQTAPLASASIEISYSEPSTAVPIPAAAPLLGAGLAALGLLARRRRA